MVSIFASARQFWLHCWPRLMTVFPLVSSDVLRIFQSPSWPVLSHSTMILFIVQWVVFPHGSASVLLSWSEKVRPCGNSHRFNALSSSRSLVPCPCPVGSLALVPPFPLSSVILSSHPSSIQHFRHHHLPISGRKSKFSYIAFCFAQLCHCLQHSLNLAFFLLIKICPKIFLNCGILYKVQTN